MRMNSSTAELQNILLHAERIREAIELTTFDDRTPNLKRFPQDCCHHACAILGIYLAEAGLGIFSKVCGERDSMHHCWLAKDDLIVDITADQFGESRPTVIVTRDPTWHKQWKVKHDSVRYDAEYYVQKTQQPYMAAAYPKVLARYHELTEHPDPPPAQ